MQQTQIFFFTHFFPLTATMIRIHIQFRFQLKVFIVAGSDLFGGKLGNCSLSDLCKKIADYP